MVLGGREGMSDSGVLHLVGFGLRGYRKYIRLGTGGSVGLMGVALVYK